MKTKTIDIMTILALFIFMLYSCGEKNNKVAESPSKNSQDMEKKITSKVPVKTFATGLNNPRGLKFGPDGYLYIAEGGLGGTDSTVGKCEQVPMAGPYKGGYTSRISKLSPDGTRSTVADSLASSQTNPQLGSFVSGVADIAFVNGQLYGIEAGAGCSHGLAGTNNTIFRVNPNGKITHIANLSKYQKAHPVAYPSKADFEPDGTWYSMISVKGDLYAIEPNHGEMIKVTTSGNIKRVIDISVSQGHTVPTVVAYHGNFYIGNLNIFPIVPGSSSIFEVTPSGQIKKIAGNLSTVLGLVFDQKDRMYVLETSTAAGNPTPNTGKLVRISTSGEQEEIASGLSFPTGMTMGPDGNLYVSNKGFGFPAGSGEILKFSLD